jgi:hypothetical protein
MNKYKFTPDPVYSLEPNQIFVFGSNESGYHGAGAALVAKKMFGAVQYQGVGLQGKSYAIPTKNRMIETLPLAKIENYIDTFIGFANINLQYEFLVTKIGCGLAGYSVNDIASLFRNKNLTNNIILPKEFVEYLLRTEVISAFEDYKNLLDKNKK